MESSRLDSEEFGYDAETTSVGRSWQTRSSDESSVKEVDPAANFQQVQSGGDQIHVKRAAISAQLQIIPSAKQKLDIDKSGQAFEEMLKDGTDELLRTSILSLRNLSDEKIVSLMQLILESDHSQVASQNQIVLFKAEASASFGRFRKLVSRVKTMASTPFITTPRSQLHRIITMTRSRQARDSTQRMSEAVAQVLEGSYLSDLQHLALPPCNASSIVKALIDGRVSTLRRLELQDYSSSGQHNPKSRFVRKLFLSGQLGQLQHLRLSSCVEADEIDALAAAFETGRIPALKHLDLSSNSFKGEPGCTCLAKLMRCRAVANLEFLDLHNCGISDGGMQALASGMKAMHPWRLRYLILGSNEIGENGFEALLGELKADRLPQLRELHMLYNYGIREESKVMAAKILEEGHVPALQVLYLPSHSMTERVAEAFLAAFKNNTALTVELLGIWWPNNLIEREALHYRERNVDLALASDFVPLRPDNLEDSHTLRIQTLRGSRSSSNFLAPDADTHPTPNICWCHKSLLTCSLLWGTHRRRVCSRLHCCGEELHPMLINLGLGIVGVMIEKRVVVENCKNSLKENQSSKEEIVM